jgi:hypothetical protein
VRRGSGFSLIEAVVAVALLAAGCSSLTLALSAVLRAQTAGASRQRAEAALEDEARRLAALPYFAPADASGPAGSLLAEVFPHASTGLNTGSASYEPEGGPAGAARFVSETTVAGLRLRRTARFCGVAGEARTCLRAADLTGWTVASAAAPPAAALEIDLEVVGAAHPAAAHLLVTAARATFAAGPRPVDVRRVA